MAEPRTEQHFQTCEKLKCSPSIDQRNCSIDEQHTSYIFLSPYNLWDMDAAALMSLNHIHDSVSLSNQYPQTTTQQPRTDLYTVIFLLVTMDNKRKIARQLCILSKNCPPDGRVKGTIATVEDLNDLWKPAAMDGVPQFVISCSCYQV